MDGALLAVAVFEPVGRVAELEQEREVGMIVQRLLYRDSEEGLGSSAGRRTRANEWRLWQEPNWSVRRESGCLGELGEWWPEREKRQMLEEPRTCRTLEERRWA